MYLTVHCCEKFYKPYKDLGQNKTRSILFQNALAGSVQKAEPVPSHLRSEVSPTDGGPDLAVGGDVSAPVLDVEAHVVPGRGLRQRLVVHLH